MAKKKFYAVKKGKETGVFETWAETSALVSGFQGAEYKSFGTKEEAEMFLSGEDLTVIDIEQDDKTLIAYVDGSSRDDIGAYGCGIVFIYPDGKEVEMSFSGDNKEAREMNNVAGELSASMKAMQTALKEGFEKLIICHDYQGVAKWCTGEWKTKNKCTQAYAHYYKVMSWHIDIKFKWIKGHSGNKYNDMADKLAKQSIGIV